MKPSTAVNQVSVLVVSKTAHSSCVWSGLLENQQNLRYVGQADAVDSLFAVVNVRKPDVVLLDTSMGVKTALATITRLAAVFPRVRTILCIRSADGYIVAPAIAAGAWGLLIEDTFAEEAVEAVRRVARGQIFLSRSYRAITVAKARIKDLARV